MMHTMVLLMLGLLSICALAQPDIPATPAGNAFSDWLTSFNSADAEQIKAFRQKYARAGGEADTLAFREATGGFELLQVESSTPGRLVALLKEVESGRGVQFELTTKATGRGDNLVMQIRPAPLPPQFAPARLSMTEAVQALNRQAAERVAADKFSGTLLVARHEQIQLQAAWGLANRELSLPASVDTQLRMGSMNKMITAVAVLQLVDAGKLSLQGTVGRYLPKYPNRDVASKVTVRHLLTHTGGTGDIFGPQFEAHRLQLQEHSDYVNLFGHRGLEFEPGAEDQYSNYGYVLLGALIEAVSGMTYYEYVDRNVYARAGMQATGSLPESVAVPKRAVGYMKEQRGWTANVDTLPYRGTAAGGGYSTVGDLFRFAVALQNGKLLSRQRLEEATKPQDVGAHYGYGFGIQGEGPTRFYGHAGGAPGMNGELRIYPESGYVLVGLSNLDPMAAENLVEYFSARMPL
ncbi:MAG: serine hydrolase domain-containing protein [Pseudomonadota bacterium]|nr:serine hydrolase domain-containing protein [Pseudomonadota bacterium]